MSATNFVKERAPLVSSDSAQVNPYNPLSSTKDGATAQFSDSLHIDVDLPQTENALTKAFHTQTPAPPPTPPSPLLEPRKKSSPVPDSDESQIPTSNGAVNTTPTRQTDPITPDITPPRVVSHGRRRLTQNRNFPSISSRAESFQTAREILSSDDDVHAGLPLDVAPLTPHSRRLPSSPQSRSSIPQQTGHSSHESSPYYVSTAEHPDPRYFPSFDGNWKEPRTKSLQLPKQRKPKDSFKGGATQPKVLATDRPVRDLGCISDREKSLRVRVKDSRKGAQRVSIEKFGKEIGWFPSDEYDNHSCRLSGLSATSTVEAVIIDSPPMKKQTLRHTGKADSLRSVGSPTTRSIRDTSISRTSEQGPRLVRKTIQITDCDRWSSGSDTLSFVSTVYSKPKQVEEIIPVVVIPRRQSSLKSSLPKPTLFGRAHSQTRSLTEHRRPTTAPNNGPVSQPFDIPKRRRTLSESLPYAQKPGGATRRASTSRPKIPTRRSSLSAPTSKNASRTTSLTLESLKRYEAVQETYPILNKQTNEKPEDLIPIINPPGSEKQLASELTVTENNDQSHLFPDHQCNDPRMQTPLSTTPFQPSIQSLSPGPIEISEARVVPFFAHNNKSLLIVEQYAQPDAAQRLRMPRTGHGAAVADRTSNMPAGSQATEVDSPLRNLRPPPRPRPPFFKITPPSSPEKNSNTTENNNELVRRWESLRRSFTYRRYADGRESGQPAHRFKNRKAGKDIDSKLYPLWRPRGFWEDFKDADARDEPALKHSSLGSDECISNSLGIPQKRLLSGPMALVRRVSNGARLRARRRRNVSHTSVVSATLSLSGRQHHALPPFLSLREMQRWVQRVRRKREREKIEARRQKLRGIIGDRVTVDPNSIAPRCIQST
ncbi:hypothetical protein LOZ12_003109 [Ophidiomyces ophidiicola]|nr:hypothetical protein LOZ62_003021 [Ophidiomyces ophidiicola]KAI2052067.1 hypothetical protein LOZ38_002406 [Ophidiomyces ophidiicola]KAI2054702.1 hypothetical protein LOZ44_002305 [Ophidiomyces ophidiicola]KAI2077546.1 hypothetical protein LOZ39_002111 [Ophidiomyces ophidiicola]KAI2081641.1 hypothetical protein LOZ37_001173 [Ophidiomyces ophidiicola]